MSKTIDKVFFLCLLIFSCNSCNERPKEIEGIWISSYRIQNGFKASFNDFLDVAQDNIVRKRFCSALNSEKEYVYSIEDSMLILKSNKIENDTFVVINIASDSMVLRKPQNYGNLLIYKRHDFIDSFPKDLFKPVLNSPYNLTSKYVHDNIEFTGMDSVSFCSKGKIKNFYWHNSIYKNLNLFVIEKENYPIFVIKSITENRIEMLSYFDLNDQVILSK